MKLDGDRSRLFLRLIHGALTSFRQPVDCHVSHAMVVNKGSGNDKDMEDLVGLEPDVKLAWQEPLRDPAAVQNSTQNVEPSHNQDPVNGGFCHACTPTRLHKEMNSGDKSKKAKADKKKSSNRSIQRV